MPLCKQRRRNVVLSSRLYNKPGLPLLERVERFYVAEEPSHEIENVLDVINCRQLVRNMFALFQAVLKICAFVAYKSKSLSFLVIYLSFQSL